MSSLADLPELVGFFSYSRSDDQHSGGALSRLRGRIHDELRLQLGRDVRLWQDTAAIPDGSLWADEITKAITESTFFIPIVTPSAVGSPHCHHEFDFFLKREKALGRQNLVFPILYIRVPGLDDEQQRRENEVLKIIFARQYVDWQKLRLRDLASTDVAERIEQFCRNIVDALRQPWVTPAEPQRREEGAVHRKAEGKRHQEEDRRKTSTEAGRQRLKRDAALTRKVEKEGFQEERPKSEEDEKAPADREPARRDAENTQSVQRDGHNTQQAMATRPWGTSITATRAACILLIIIGVTVILPAIFDLTGFDQYWNPGLYFLVISLVALAAASAVLGVQLASKTASHFPPGKGPTT
jgi:hypothetical protein